MPRGPREKRPADVIGNAIHVLQIATGKLRTRDMTREKSALSKKFDTHVHMVALYMIWYNYVKQYTRLEGVSPAMAAGTNILWSMTDLAEMIDANLPTPCPRGPYKKQLVVA